MAIFPILIEKLSLRNNDSRSGGKDYHLVLIARESGENAVLIKRWGKKGQWGNGLKVETYPTYELAQEEFAKVARSKESRGYDETLIANGKSANSEAEFKAALGPQYWAKMGKFNLDFLVPGIDTTGVKEDLPPDYEEGPDGGWVRKERAPKPLVLTPEQIEAREREAAAAEEMRAAKAADAKRREEAERLAENPHWGAF